MTTQTIDDIYKSLSSPELEKAFIGGLLTYPERLRLCDLQPDDLYDPRHRLLYEAIRDMDLRGEPIDETALVEHLRGRNKLEAAGGFDYLITQIVLANSLISGHPDEYVKALSDLSTRRRVLRLSSELARAVHDRSRGIDETINDFSAKLPRLVRVAGGAQHISVYASRYYDRINEAMSDPEELERRKITTGFIDLDEATGGFRPGEMVLIYGKPGLGKTKFVHQMAAQLAQRGFPGAVYQLETGEDEIMEREFSREMKIPSERLENAMLDDEEIIRFTQVVERLSAEGYPLYLDFTNGWNTTTLRADLSRLKAERGIRWFVLDYLRFMTDTFGKDETERENYISSQLKRICRELDLTGFVIHSMNKRGIASDAPDLEDGSGGAGISFDCDKAIFMVEHIPDSGNPEDRLANYRTFVFRKSRRKLKFSKFHLQTTRDYPAFLNVAKPDQIEQEQNHA